MHYVFLLCLIYMSRECWGVHLHRIDIGDPLEVPGSAGRATIREILKLEVSQQFE